MRSTITRKILETFRMKALYRLLVAAIGAAAFASCTQNGGLIYLNIQKVTKTTTSTSIPLDITVSDIANVGTNNATAPYYVAAGKIYNGTAPVGGSTSWGAISVPQTTGKDMLCNTMTYDLLNNKLWAGFFSSNASTFGLYSMSPGTTPVVWTQLVDNLNPTAQITYLNVPSSTDGRLFAVVSWMVGGNPFYELDTYNGTTWTATSLNTTTAASNKPITSVALLGSTYYATCGNTLFSAPASGYPALSFAAALSPGTIPIATDSNDILQNIFIDANYNNQGGLTPLIAVLSSNQTVNPGIGSVYYSMNGGSTWTKATTNGNTSYTVGFLCVAGPVDLNHTVYLLGSDSGVGGAFGFFSFVPSTIGLSRFGGLSYSLYASAVRRILVDQTNNLVAMGTINNGLWVTIGIDTTGGFGSSTWTQE